MIRYDRQTKITEYLELHKSATVRELSEVLFASEASIRRDIETLEKQGFVRKIYGGVILSKYQNGVVPVNLRDSDNSGVKDALAFRAVGLIHDGDTVIMDASSTVRRMVKHMSHLRDVKIITNNLRIFSECDNSAIKLYCTGGTYSPENHAFIGPAAESYLRSVSADLLFFSSQGITEDGIISDASEDESSLRRVMLASASRKFFLCDSSKLGIRKMFTLCNRSHLDGIICDKPIFDDDKENEEEE